MKKLKLKMLQNVSMSVIAEVFNRAFSDYIMPVQITESAMRRKIRGDQIDLDLSPGCFIEAELCGFILHGICRRGVQRIAWNGGTGVVPSQRGQGITSRLYEFIVPILRDRGFTVLVLEVIDSNSPAIHIYRQQGFETTRELDSYQGIVSPVELHPQIEMRDVTEFEWRELEKFWSWPPSFQNAEHKILQLRDEVQIVVAFKNELPVGYIVFGNSLDEGDVYQFAVDEDFRGRGIGRALFATAAAGKTVPLKVINVDASHKPSRIFLKKIGLKHTVRQIEMAKKL